MGKRRGRKKNKKEAEKGDFYFLRELGSGSFSYVHLCQMKETGEKFAMKVVHKSVSDSSPVYEVHILRKIKHENIVRFLDYRLENLLFIHMEYVEGHPLYLVVKEELIDLNTKQILNIMTPLMSALTYLHGLKIIHGDVATRNLIVKINESKEIETIKLIDFGLSCYENKLLNRGCLFNDEIAPELMFNMKYTCKIDVWSAGMVLKFLLEPMVPIFLQFLFTMTFDFRALMPFIDPQFCNLLGGMLCRNQDLRLSSIDVLKLLKGMYEDPPDSKEDIQGLEFLFDHLN